MTQYTVLYDGFPSSVYFDTIEEAEEYRIKTIRRAQYDTRIIEVEPLESNSEEC